MRNRGITLIALVITIIVLLILAGITISLTIGNQGVITRAQQAAKNYKDAEQKEQETINQLEDNVILSQYIKNGLIVQYDAINNTGNGHSNDTEILKNLAGESQYDGKIKGATINSNYISFDGQDDYIAVGDVDSSVITIEMTVKIYDEYGNRDRKLISNTALGGIAVCLWNNDNRLSCCARGGDTYIRAYSSSEITTEIMNIVAVFDGNNINIYVNNNLVGNTNLEGRKYNAPINNTIMILGAEPEGSVASDAYTKMDLYSCRIYNRVLSKEEMTNNYELDKERFMK